MIYGRQSKSAPVGVVAKVLRILEAINASPSGLQLREIAQHTGINKSTAYRFMAHLEVEGYLFRDETGAYIVGPKLVRLGSAQIIRRPFGRSAVQSCRICGRPPVKQSISACSTGTTCFIST